MEREIGFPEEIAERILSFLPTEEAVRPSLLSKTWLSASSKLGNFDLNNGRFRNMFFPGSESDVEFIKFVDNILHRHCRHDDVTIDKFKLYLSLHLSDKELIYSFEKWLEIALAKHVKHLHIHLHLDQPKPFSFYTIPQTIFTAKSLVVLVVSGTKYFKFSLRGEVLEKCYTLKELYIGGVKVKKSTISKLCTIFPCIEDFTLDYCFRLWEIELSGLTNLKKFYIISRTFVPVVKLTEAHSLEAFTYRSYHRGVDLDPQLFNISPCQGLKYLSLSDSNITDSSFHSLISQCPVLEYLKLRCCIELERISISSHTLESLTLSNHRKLEEVNIDAPNLIHLEYEGNVKPSFSLINPSQDLKRTVHIYCSDDLKTSYFIKLRRLLTQLSPSEVTLTIDKKIRVDMEELRRAQVLDPKPKLEKLELHLFRHSSTFLHGLWWSCCPAKLTVPWNRHNQSATKFLFKMLMKRRCQKCCRSDPSRCWRHYLNNVNAEYFEDSKYLEKSEDQSILSHQLDWNSLVNRSLAWYEELKIYYSLEWQSF